MDKLSRPAKFLIDGEVFCIAKDYAALNNSKLKVFQKDNGQFSTTCKLPQAYYKKLRFHPKQNIDCLKLKNSIKICLPTKYGPEAVTITGDSRQDVEEATNELHQLVSSIRSSMRPNKFISIPTISEEIQSNFLKFKADVMKLSDEIENLEESIFQKPEKLHLTIAVLNLLDDSECEEACKTMENLKNEVLIPMLKDKEDILVNLKGIYSMTPNESKTHVLYSKATIVNETPEFNMQLLANTIADYFYERGLLVQPKESVKIHVTLINTKYREPSKQQRRFVKKVPIDASKVIETYKDFDFGTCPLKTVRLCLMSPVGNDGNYRAISIVEVK